MKRLVVLGVIGLLILSGCGGDGGGSLPVGTLEVCNGTAFDIDAVEVDDHGVVRSYGVSLAPGACTTIDEFAPPSVYFEIVWSNEHPNTGVLEHINEGMVSTFTVNAR